MDNLLVSLLNAGDEHERQQRVDELLTIHVAPIVRQVLRQRLGLYVSARGVNEHNHDAEDLYQDAMTRMVEVLNSDQHSLRTIENLERYVGRIVSNICIDFLRSKYPIRARLKDALRDIFRRHADLVSWQYEDDIVCGFAAWRNIGKQPVAAYDIDTKLNAFLSAHFADDDVRVVPLSRIVTEIFQWFGGPVQIDLLVRILAHIRDIKDQQIESLDSAVADEAEPNLDGSTRSVESDLETHELLGRLWHLVNRLTPRQRYAFALGFEDPDGRNLFTVLLAAGIADLDEIADGMGRPVAEIAHLWIRMPMDSATIAGELRTSRQNVYKWRYRALQKLKAELK